MSIRSSSALSRGPATIDSLPEYKTLTTIVKQYYKASTPQIPEIMKETTNLHKVAEIFSSFITAVSTEHVTMTSTAATLIDRTVRYLLCTALENARNTTLYQQYSNTLRVSMSIQSQLRDADIEELRIRLAEALTYIEDVQSHNKDSQKDQAQLAQEIETLYRDGTRLKEKFLANKRAYEEQLFKAQATNQVLEDKLREVSDKLLIQHEKMNSLNVQLAHANNEIETLTEENASLKKQLAERKKLIVKSRQALEHSKHQIAEGKINMKRLYNELEALKGANVQPTPSQLEKMAGENYSLQQEIAQLKGQLLEYEGRLNIISRDNDLSSSLSLQNRKEEEEEINKLHQQLYDANDKIELLKQTIEDLEEKQAIAQEDRLLQEEKIAETEKQLSEAHGTITEMEKLFNDMNITPDDLPNLIDSANENPKLMASIQKLRSSLDALCRFTKKLIEEDTAETKILDQNAALFNDEELRNEIVTRIEEMRDYAHQLSPDDLDIVLMYDAIFGFNDNVQALIDNTILKRENNIYAGLVILVAILNKSQKFVSQIDSDLDGVYKQLPFKREKHNPIDVADYFESLQGPIKRIKSILKKEFGKFDASATTADQLNTFMDIIEELLENMNNEIRPIINYKRSVLKLPEALSEEIEKLRSKVDSLTTLHQTEMSETQQKYDQKLDELTKELQQTRNREDITVRFQDIIQRKDEEIRRARNELSEILDKNLMVESQCTSLQSKSMETELNSTVIKNQRNRLQTLLDQRTRAYERTIQELTEASDQRAQEEVALVTKKFTAEKEVIVKQLAAKSKKVKDLKAQLKEVVNSFESIVQHQRSEMSALVEQNTRMSRKVAKFKIIIKNQEADRQLEASLAANESLLQSITTNDSAILNTTANGNASLVGAPSIRSVDTPSRIKTAAPSVVGSMTPSRMSTITSPSRGASMTPRSAASKPTRTSEAVLDVLAEIGAALTPYAGVKPNWTKPRIISTINELVQRAAGTGVVVADDEWKKWAAGLIVSSKSNLTADEMRIMIKEMVRAGPSRLKASEKLQSLREQKKLLLLRSNLPQKSDPLIINVRILISVVLLAQAISKTTKRGVMPQTPTRPILRNRSNSRLSTPVRSKTPMK
ncbi:hypothetical protein TRFO_06428 [Tritrichomonas foetus]|uniref:Uncharacterized protein n=1 Tax=Tritrichomonas foetus TaxID=1144522 RepID=A0A1J4JY87_9EUKA|nr:hypothetical protein TRFO_06428 [Tritrichomonas foetus]|eukprot:OHT04121.1 hypothetical protein TRFO_06428 [Tritrichomonas foetus]